MLPNALFLLEFIKLYLYYNFYRCIRNLTVKMLVFLKKVKIPPKNIETKIFIFIFTHRNVRPYFLLQNVISFAGILCEHVLIRAGIVIRGWIEFRQVSLGLMYLCLQ